VGVEMSITYELENGSSITTVDNIGQNRRSLRGERQLARLGTTDEDFNENDQRYLDDRLIEHYSDIPCSVNKWLNVDSTKEVWNDIMTAYEIDGFDEYSEQPLSDVHKIEHVEEYLKMLGIPTYEEFVIKEFLDYMRTKGERVNEAIY
jgi:hypothetical protein